jgi:hypothetical protein
MLFLFAAVAIWSLLQRTDPKADIAWFWVLFLLVYASITWINLFKTANELKIDGELLKWRSPFRSGEMPCRDVQSVRNIVPSWPWPVVRIGSSGGRNIYVLAKRSLQGFVDRLLVENHRIEVDAKSYQSWRHESFLG